MSGQGTLLQFFSHIDADWLASQAAAEFSQGILEIGKQKAAFPAIREKPLARVEFDWFARRYFVVGAGVGPEVVAVAL